MKHVKTRKTRMIKDLLPEILMFASFMAYQTYMIDGIILLSVSGVIFMSFFKRLNTLSLIFIFFSFAANYNSFMTCCVLIMIAVSLNTYEEKLDDSFYNYYNKQTERAYRYFRDCKEGQTILSHYCETGDGYVMFTYYQRQNGNMKKYIETEKKEDFYARTWNYGKI
jgi:hypothetical protein